MSKTWKDSKTCDTLGVREKHRYPNHPKRDTTSRNKRSMLVNALLEGEGRDD